MLRLDNTKFVILSCDPYIENRIDSIKKTWGKSINKVFIVDSSNNNSGDIIGYDTSKTYEGIQEKYIEFFTNYKFNEFDYYFFTDDDTFVVLKNLEEEKINSSNPKFYLGRHLILSETGMDKWGNNTYYPLERITGKNCNLPLNYASGGSGFILSRSSCNSIKNYLTSTPKEDIQRSAHGDVSIGFWARSSGVEFIPSNNFWWDLPEKLIDNKWEKYQNNGKELTFHYVSPERMEELNEKYNGK